MKKIILLSILLSFLSSCYGKILTADASYKKFYTLKFDKFVNNVGETWTGAKAELTSDESGFNLDYGKIAGNITALFTVTYTGSNVLTTNPLSFEKIGLSDHFVFDIEDCSKKGLNKNESCTFSVTYKYSDSDDLNLIDNLSFLISDPDKIGSTIDDLFIVNLSGHRKVKGTLSIDTEQVDFGTHDFNLAPEPKLINISYSGEFNIESVSPDLTGSDSLRPLFDVSEINCEGGVTCIAMVKFPALTVPGSAYGANSLKLKYKVMLEGADNLEELGNITLEGKRKSETNLVLYNEAGDIISSPLSLNDLNETYKTSTITVKNEGETETSNFNFVLNNTNDFIIDTNGTTCVLGNDLVFEETCNIKINFTQSDIGVYSSTLSVSSDRIETITANFEGKVFVPASLNVEPSGIIDLGSVVAQEAVANTLFSTTFITLKKSIGEVPAKITNLELNDANFYIDDSWVSNEKCDVDSILNNVNDVCLIKVIFNPQTQATYPKNLGSILSFSYNNGKNVIVSGNNISLTGLALEDAQLSFDTNTLNFGTIIKDETKTHELNITNTGGINVAASFELINNTIFSITSNECLNVIEPNETCKITLLFNPNNVKSTFTTILKVTYSNASGIVIDPQIALIASSINPAIISINPITQDFGQHRFGIDAPIQKEFVVTNEGDLEATEISANLANSFQNSFEILNTSTCGAALNIGLTCNLLVEFDPPIHISEVLNTSLNINYKDRPAATLISSTSSQIEAEAISYADLVLDSGNGNFGEVLINTENSVLLSFTNNGYSKAVISNLESSSESITIDTSIIDSCDIGSEIDVLETCNIGLVFNPSDASNLAFNDSFILTYTTYDLTNNLNVALSASVLVPAKLEFMPGTYNFEATEEGNESTNVSFEIKLTQGTIATQITAFNLEDTTNFTITDINNCINHIFDADNQTCNILVKFNPELIEAPNGNLPFNSLFSAEFDQGYGQGLINSELNLSGTSIGSNAVLGTLSEPLLFGGKIRGTQSQAKIITINKLSGNHNAVISNVEVLADNSGYVNFVVNSICGEPYAANPVSIIMEETCDLSLTFSPSIENTNEIDVISSIKITYDDRSGYSNSSTQLLLSDILEGEVKLEAIIEISDLVFGNITQGNSKNVSLILNMTQGVNPALQSQNIIKSDIVCSGDIVDSFNININTGLTQCDLQSAGDICEINLTISGLMLTDELYPQCQGQYDVLIGEYKLDYNNGLDDVSATATLNGNSLTPAKLVFNQTTVYTKNLNEYFCYNYDEPGNDSPEICQLDIDNNEPDDLIYNGGLIGLNKSYNSTSDNLSLVNLGETPAKIIKEYRNNGPFVYNIDGFTYPYSNPIYINYLDSRQINQISFLPTDNNYFIDGGHRGFGNYEIGMNYQNGIGNTVVNTLSDTTITEAQKKLNLLVTGLKVANLKLQTIDEYNNIVECSDGGKNCQFNNGNDIVYYKQNGTHQIFNNLNTSQIFALTYDDGDVPARLEDPENTSATLGGFYYENNPYGTNSDCEVGDYIFTQAGDNIKNYCLIDLSFKYSDEDTTYCGYNHSKNKIYKYSKYIWIFMDHAGVISEYKNQEVSSGIRPALSFDEEMGDGNYCALYFGMNNSQKSVTLKNYSQDEVTVDLSYLGLNSYYIENPSKGETQNDFTINSSTCGGVLSAGAICDIDITFDRDIQANGHAKFKYYNYRIPFSILSYSNNFDIEADAVTFNEELTTNTSSIKQTRIGTSNSDLISYFCYDCADNNININLENDSPAPVKLSSTKMNIYNSSGAKTSLNNSLFEHSINGGASYISYNSFIPSLFDGGELDYLTKVVNTSSFFASMGGVFFYRNNPFHTFYDLDDYYDTYSVKTAQFEFGYTTMFDGIVAFVNGELSTGGISAGSSSFNNIDKSFIISKNQLIHMCSVMEDKLADPISPIYGQTEAYLTEFFKEDCCEEAGIFCDI